MEVRHRSLFYSNLRSTHTRFSYAGPGSSSMIGLFRELGPCRINNASTDVSLNPTSWSTNSNFIFIDQPVGVGYSHGDLKVGTSQQAAADTWTFLQIFFSDAKFAPLAKRPFALWTESYGGHYGPEFAAYFLSQNAAIAAGKISGIPINLKTLGVGDGLTNPLLQYPGYISYSVSNPYHPLTTADTIQIANTSWSQEGGCRDQITSCYTTGNNSICSGAQTFCNSKVLTPLAGNWDVDYLYKTCYRICGALTFTIDRWTTSSAKIRTHTPLN
jgi:carboxypeptidase C (cathepsin A)